MFYANYMRERMKVPKYAEAEGNPITIADSLERPVRDMRILGESTQTTLPHEYQKVEYISSTGTQYIDTGVKPTNNTMVEIKYASNVNSYFMLYGSRTSIDSTDKHSFYKNEGSGYYTGFGGDNLNGSDIYDMSSLEAHTMINGASGLYIDNVLVTTYQNYTFSSALSMYLFGLNQANALDSRTFRGKIYSCKIYESSILIRNFVPCYCKINNVVGLYDLVNGVFYTNLGTGVFSIGAEDYSNHATPTPDAPIDVVSVENPIVTVTGKNLFDIDNIKVAFVNEWSKTYSPKIENGVLYSGGVASETSGGYCYVYCGKKPCTISLTITFVDAPGTDYVQTHYEYIDVIQFDDVTEKGYWINSENLTMVRQIKNKRYNITIHPTKDYVGFAVTHYTTKYAIKVTDIQIELGETATEYEPYKEEQKVSLDGITLRGLKDSKGNFVARDEIILDGVKNTVKLSTNVLEWVMDGVSAGRGLLTVNTYTSAMYGVTKFKASIPKPIIKYVGFCNYFKNCKAYYPNAKDTYTFNGDSFFIECSSISEVGKNGQAQAWFKERFEEGNPAIFYFAMTEPIETDITNTEIGQKLLELYTNRGTTNISLNSESDLGEIWVRYIRK